MKRSFLVAPAAVGLVIVGGLALSGCGGSAGSSASALPSAASAAASAASSAAASVKSSAAVTAECAAVETLMNTTAAKNLQAAEDSGDAATALAPIQAAATEFSKALASLPPGSQLQAALQDYSGQLTSIKASGQVAQAQLQSLKQAQQNLQQTYQSTCKS